MLSTGIRACGSQDAPLPVGTACGEDAMERREFPWGEGLALGCPEKVRRGPTWKGCQYEESEPKCDGKGIQSGEQVGVQHGRQTPTG